MTMGRQRSKHLDATEWDFTNLDERELSFCLEYEIERELLTAAWRKSIMEFRSAAKLVSMAPPRKQFQTLFAHAKKCEARHPKGQWELSWPKLFMTLWPDEPYLRVQQAERNYRCAKWTAFFEPDQEDPLEVVPLGELIQRREDILANRNLSLEYSDPNFAEIAEIYQIFADTHARDPLSAELAKSPKEIAPIFTDACGVDIVTFRISTRNSIGKIKKRFERWLNARRAEIEEGAKKSKGGFRKIESHLNALGAWRLEECFGDYKTARKWAEDNALKLPYGKSKWRGAVKRASQYLALGNPNGRRRNDVPR